MNLARFLSFRLIFSLGKQKGVSHPIIRLIIIGISISLAIMLVAVAIVTGFKSEIEKKLTGFSAHISILHLDNNATYETLPILKNPSYKDKLSQLENVAHMQAFATKPGVIKTAESIQGIILYGVDSDFDWAFFSSSLVSGTTFQVSDSITSKHIFLSEYIANLLKLKVGDRVDMYFVQKHLRARRFTLTGIYNTGMEEFDKLIALCDIKQVQKLNNWTKNEVSGYGIFLKNLTKLDKSTKEIYGLVANYRDEKGNLLNVKNIKEQHPLIFDWLELINVNVWLILVLLIIVASFNMISGMLVLILEKTKFTAILKSLGMHNWHISKVFLHIASYIILKGIIWGNVLAILLLAVQYYFKLVKLNPELYFISTVPINFRIDYWLFVNVFTFFLILIISVLPTYFLTRLIFNREFIRLT